MNFAESLKSTESSGIFGKLDSINPLESAQFYLDSGVKSLYAEVSEEKYLREILDLKIRFPRIILLLKHPKIAWLVESKNTKNIDFVILDLRFFTRDFLEKLHSLKITPIAEIKTNDDIKIAQNRGIKKLCVNEKYLANIAFDGICDIMLDSNINCINNAFLAFSRFDAVLLGDFALNKGKFLHKIQRKVQKRARFYQNLLDKNEIKIKIESLDFDKICETLSAQNIDAIAFKLDSVNIKKSKNILRFLNKFRPKVLKIGILDDINLLNQARNLVDSTLLDALELRDFKPHNLENPKKPIELQNLNKLKNANFAFYAPQKNLNDICGDSTSTENPLDNFLQFQLTNRLKFI